MTSTISYLITVECGWGALADLSDALAAWRIERPLVVSDAPSSIP